MANVKCECSSEYTGLCLKFQGGLIGGMALAGGIAAPFTLTAVTVASVAMTVGLFAAPAAIIGIGMFTLFTLSADVRKGDCLYIMEWIQAGVFVLASAATITGAFMLGLLTTPLMIVFIVASVVATIAISAGACTLQKLSAAFF